MSDQPANLRSLFDAASELPPEAQEAWLEQHCADPALRERVRRLLRAQVRTQDPLAIAPQERLAAIDIPKPALGERRRIADFTLIRPVGHGGMATVYLAERSGFAQRVAIKLLHRTLLSDLDRKLFERERKVLASLEHPSIARLIDGGVTELHEPYLVMEYVEGLPITEYARQRALAPAARVALLIDVCDAVATAHAQLIVHRDLKPSNVLINAEGRVKLLDFGVAKVLADDAELTREGVAGFTPDYAAPEQIGDGVISTATDVYALGVMALELLIGSKRAALRKLKPSQAVLLPDEEGATLALTQRGLAHFLRGDLDNVLQKCLEEDPQRRYQGAAALAEDLRRFLRHQPVSAHPPSRWYLVRKFALRHRGGVILTALLTLATLTSLVLALRWGQEARMQAERAAQLATDAEQARARAETALQVSQTVQDFLIDMFDEAVPSVPQAQEPSVRELVSRAEQRVDEELAQAPAVAVELYRSLVQMHNAMSDYPGAKRISAKAVAFAKAHFPADSLELRRIEFGDAMLRERGREAGALEQMEALVARLAPGDVGIEALQQRTSLGAALAQSGRTDEGVALLAQSLPPLRSQCAGASQTDACRLLATALNNLNVSSFAARRYEIAQRYGLEALELARRTYGEEHRETAKLIGNLGLVEFYLGHQAQALAHTLQSIDLFERIEGSDSLSINYMRQTLANVYAVSGRKLEAIAVHERVIRDVDSGRQTGLGVDVFRINYAKELIQVGRYREAEQQLALAQALLGPDSPKSRGGLARIHEARALIRAEADGDQAGALAEAEAALALRPLNPDATATERILTLLIAHRVASTPTLLPQAAAYWAEIESLAAKDAHTLPSVQRGMALRRAEMALAQGDGAGMRAALAQLRATIDHQVPHAYEDEAQLIEREWQTRSGAVPADQKAWLAELSSRYGPDARLVRRGQALLGSP